MRKDGISLRRALLFASAIEAFYLLILLGYGPLYLHERLHAGYFVSSQAAAIPALATFVGSLLWGQLARRMGLRTLVLVGLSGYLASGVTIFLVRDPVQYIVGVSLITVCSSALAPATLAFLTHEGGNMGRRLATRLQWQSSGWMMGGLLGGYVYDLSTHSYGDLMLVLAAMLGIPLLLIARQPKMRPGLLNAAPSHQGGADRPGHRGLMLLLVLPFFLAYAGNEGFFTNFGLFLRILNIPVGWVGWSAAISTGLGWLMASRIGRWSDRWGGKSLLTRVLVVYVVMYVVMSVVPYTWIVVGAFALPLYPLLNIGIQRAVAESIPGEIHGAAMGMINGASGLATFLGGLLIGGVEAQGGPHFMPWTAAGLVAVGLVIAVVVYRRHPVRGLGGVQ